MYQIVGEIDSVFTELSTYKFLVTQSLDTYVNKLCQAIKILLLVYCDLVCLVDDPVVLHPPFKADTERVVTGEIG